jgi:uncharacterized protein YodC (DUF2158 family)
MQEAKGIMTDQAFKIGDVVSLVSGGPAMTVRRVDAAVADYSSDVHVEWFDSVGHLQDAYFHPDMLLYACVCSECVGDDDDGGFELDDEPPKERAS